MMTLQQADGFYNEILSRVDFLRRSTSASPSSIISCLNFKATFEKIATHSCYLNFAFNPSLHLLDPYIS